MSMTEGKHTPGDWYYYKFGGNTAAQPEARFVLNLPVVSDKHGSGLANESDARLIAAAPELLSALQMLMKCTIELAPYDPAVTIAVVAIVDIAHSAILKATGANP